MAKLIAFDSQSIQRIAQAIRRLEATPHKLPLRDRQWPATLGRDRWYGKTATCYEFPDYPQPPPETADTYCVQLVERYYTEEPGDQDQTQIDDARHVVARLACPTDDRRWIPEGTEVEVFRLPTRRGPRYYFRPLAEQERLFELAQPLDCGSTALAYLLLGSGAKRVTDMTFDVTDRVNLVGTLPGAPEFAPAGTNGIAKWFHDRHSWDIIALGSCEDDPCDFTGEVTVGTGELYIGGDGCSICEDLVTMTFERGRLCEVEETEGYCQPLPQQTIEGGTCIEVETITGGGDGGCGGVTINNTMTVKGGECIEVSGECDLTVNNTMTVTGGECIEVEKDGCAHTVKNTMTVVAGDGIKVEKNGCAYAVSMNLGNADPKVTLRLLCGVEITPIQITCVQDYEGNWDFAVTGGVLTEHFTTITLPASIVEYTSDCDGGYDDPPPAGCADCPDCEPHQNLIFNPTTQECYCQGPWQPLPDNWVYCHPPKPVPQCDDCPDCPEGQVKIMQQGTGVCNCIDDEASLPEGWVECPTEDPAPAGSGILLTSVTRLATTPHFAFAFLGFPAGAVSYEIEVTGDRGSTAFVGPIDTPGETVPDQEYWGALVDGWGDPEPGECFVFEATFRDAYGAVVAVQIFVGCCEPWTEYEEYEYYH